MLSMIIVIDKTSFLILEETKIINNSIPLIQSNKLADLKKRIKYFYSTFYLQYAKNRFELCNPF